MSQTAQPDGVDYGIDAPGVIRGLLGSGATGLAIAVALVGFGPGLVAIAGGLIALASVVPFLLGLAMISYVRRGKFALRDWMLARHPWRGDEHVIDIGAGRGLMAIGAAALLPQGHVIALDLWRAEDLSDNGPDQLQDNAARMDVADRIEIVTGDACAIPLPDASVDRALSVLCLHNIEPAADRDRACREIARVLKPGGRALIADYTGTQGYVRALADAGCTIDGHYNLVGLCRSLMWVVEARRPGNAIEHPIVALPSRSRRATVINLA